MPSSWGIRHVPSKIFYLSKGGQQEVVAVSCSDRNTSMQWNSQMLLGKMLWKIHCSLMQVEDGWVWEIDMQRTTGLLSVLLELEKCRESSHCFLSATRFIWDHSEGRVQWSMAGIVTETLGCFPRAAPSVTAAHRTDSSSGRREQGTAADLGNRIGITYMYCKLNVAFFISQITHFFLVHRK